MFLGKTENYNFLKKMYFSKENCYVLNKNVFVLGVWYVYTLFYLISIYASMVIHSMTCGSNTSWEASRGYKFFRVPPRGGQGAPNKRLKSPDNSYKLVEEGWRKKVCGLRCHGPEARRITSISSNGNGDDDGDGDDDGNG